MKRALLAAAIAVAVFAGVFGLAASLSVTSSSLGAGTDVVASCQASGTISADYDPAFSATLGEYDAVAVELSGIHANCDGLAYKVTLADGSDAALGSEATGTISGTTASLTFTGVSAASVENIHVTIYG